MAYALTSEYVALNGSDYSAYINSAVLTVTAAELDTTTFASDGWTEVQAGLKGGSLAINFLDSVTDNEIDEILWGLFATKVPFEVRGTDASVTANNAKYTGTVLIKDHTIGGSVGDLASKSLTFTTSGAISRAVS